MKIYNYLFYKSYQMGERSKNFVGAPVLGGILWVGGVFMFNLGSIAFLLEAFGITGNLIGDRKYKYFVGLLFMVFLLFYYSYKGRYKKIIAHYEEKERNTSKAIPPLIVVLFYTIISFGLLLLSGMYKNGDGLFK